MSTTPTPMTELGAVNLMLMTIGESPLNSLGGDANQDVAIARQLLDVTSKLVQSEGWEFNMESDYTISPDGAGNLIIPSNVCSINASTDSDRRMVQRAGKFYDRINHTFVFTTAVQAEVIWMFPFDDLPEPMRLYVAIRSARVFQAKVLGSETLQKFSAVDEQMARANVMSEEANTADANILNGPDQWFTTRRGQRYGGRY